MAGYNVFFDGAQLALWQMAANHRAGIGRMACQSLKALLSRPDVKVWLVFPAGNREYGEKFVACHPWAARSAFLPYPCSAAFRLRPEIFSRAKGWLGKMLAIFPSKLQARLKKALRRRPNAIYAAFDEELKRAVTAKMAPEAANIWFSPNQPIPESVRDIPGLRKYVVLHDIIPLRLPEKHPGFEPCLDLMRQHLRKADIIWANSNFTARDFLDYFPEADPARIKVAWHGGADDFDDSPNRPPEIPLKLARPDGRAPYFVTLGALEPRKGLTCVMKAFKKLREKYPETRLIMIGPKGWDYARILLTALSEKNIELPGYLEDGAVATLLKGAIALIYISEYEGFGLPVVEGMACGCPVIAANASSLPEIGGDAALFVPKGDSLELANSMEKLYLDSALRQKLSRAGLVRSRNFTWAAFVDRILTEGRN